MNEDLIESIELSLRGCRDRLAAVDRALDMVQAWKSYFWIGVYRVEGKRARRVSYRGPLPPCHEFEFGRGNVGTTAMTGLKKVVPDVARDPVYSACFAATRSELILPIYSPKQQKLVVGVMDVESDRPDFFALEDEKALGRVCALLAPWLES